VFGLDAADHLGDLVVGDHGERLRRPVGVDEGDAT